MESRLTPDQKVACSIHVGFNTPVQFGFLFSFYFLPTCSADVAEGDRAPGGTTSHTRAVWICPTWGGLITPVPNPSHEHYTK
ncbi:hypothetical protein PVAP13_1NG319119 [Panicum virgatum]|uniref:Uncharacterized protein n=1 Tax=Panicum virgatum TaxID=38727 RepID=A0A8T0WX71_PANVG|nr:hypothetical protein PVAP13_1NG319119 [Panicum virgatum]